MSNTTTEIPTQNQTASTPQVKRNKVILGKFGGAFGSQMQSAFVDCKACGIDDKVSHKIGNDFGSASGKAMAEADLKAAISKANDNGESRFNYTGKSEYVRQSPAMTIVRIVRLIDGMKKEKVITDRFFPSTDVLPIMVQEYLTEAQDWADSQDWE